MVNDNDDRYYVSGKTLIDVPRNMLVHPDGVKVENLASFGEPFYLYAFDEVEMRFVLAVGFASRARQEVEAVQISFEWRSKGETHGDGIVCSPNCPLLTLDGKWIVARDSLRERIRPLSRGFSQGYYRILAYPLSGRFTLENRFIASEMYGDIQGMHAHHIDGNQVNNSVENVLPMDGAEHNRMHSIGRFVSEESRRKLSEARMGMKFSEETKQRISASKTGERHPNFGRPRSDETRRRMGVSKIGEKNPQYKSVSLQEIHDALREAGTTSGASVLLGIGRGTLLDKIRDAGFNNADALISAFESQENHRVSAINTVVSAIDVYTVIVPDYNNFVANGIVVAGQW